MSPSHALEARPRLELEWLDKLLSNSPELTKLVSRGGIDEMTAVAVRSNLSVTTVDLRR